MATVRSVAKGLKVDLSSFETITVTVDASTDNIVVSDGTLAFAVTQHTCRDFEYGEILSQCREGIAMLRIVNIARVCHEANRAWCAANGDHSQKPWDEAEDWQRESAVNGVRFALNNPSAPDSAQHDAWMADKVRDGWVYGAEKDAKAKTHPCIVPFGQLPEYQQAKDKLFKAIVQSLRNAP